MDGIVITPYQGRRWNYTVIISMAALLAIIIAPISQVGSRTVQGYAYGNYFNVDHLKNLALSSSLGRTEFPPGSPFMAGCRLRYYWFYLWFPGLLYRTGLNASSFETAFMTYGCVWSLVLVLMLFLWWRRLGVSSRWGAAALGIAVAAPSLNAVTYIWRLALHKNLTPSLLFAQDTEFISPLNFARVPFFVDGLFRYVLYIQLHLFGLILLLTSLWILVSATPGNERKTLFLSAVPAVVGLFFTDIVSVLGVLIWSAGALCLVFRVRRSPKIIWNSLKYTGLGAVFVCAVTACLLPGTRAGLQVLFLLKMTGHLMVEYGPLLFLGLIGLSVIKKPELSSMFSTMVVISLGVLFLVGERGYLKLYLPSFISGALNRYPFHISVKTSVVLLGALLVLAGPGLGKIADACKRSGRVRLGTALLLVLVVLALPGSVVDL
ncbi:MAG: hypothetical protein QGH40_13250, partial [bacterium]|nr:hypothetical protein [bacterium]